MNKLDSAAGFYGKLPSHGDFLSRRLPRNFIEPWDQWLQGGLAASQQQLGKNWLNHFLVSPIWQFALTPGLCGDDAWAGVMMPSVDRVGRYFPLTLAARANTLDVQQLFDPSCDWFEALSQLALSTLDYQFNLDDFDARLQALRLADFLAGQKDPIRQLAPSSAARQAFQFQLARLDDTPQAFTALTEQLQQRFLAQCSFWRSVSGEDDSARFLVCDGLPPIDAYLGFLNDAWPQRGWQLSVQRVTGENGRASQPKVPALVSTAALLQPRSPDSAAILESCAISVVGLRRQLNEDAVLDRADAGMWVVADGMGGHSAGDVASQSLVKALAQVPQVDDLEHYSEQVSACLHQVNHELLQMAATHGPGQIIGSTVVVLLIAGTEFRVLWAGDSRLYRYRQGVLEQLTSDHSLYNESISQGVDPLDGSLAEGRGNIITRAVGADAQLQVAVGQGDIVAGDLFMLCSDGVDKELSHADIAEYCRAGSAVDIAHRLIAAAEERGGRDNISVIVVKQA